MPQYSGIVKLAKTEAFEAFSVSQIRSLVRVQVPLPGVHHLLLYFGLIVKNM